MENNEMLKILYDERKTLVLMINQTDDKLRNLRLWKENLDKHINKLEGKDE